MTELDARKESLKVCVMSHLARCTVVLPNVFCNQTILEAFAEIISPEPGDEEILQAIMGELVEHKIAKPN